jgi:hypothetical protein
MYFEVDMQFQTGKLVRDPGRYFETPEDLLECETLSRREKFTLLMCWYQDLIEHQRAREGYLGNNETAHPGRAKVKLQQVAAALDVLRQTIH